MAAPTNQAAPQTGAHAVIADAVDPARRPDVLLRVRRDEGHEVSAWWMVGAFVGVSAAVISLLSWVPGGS
ncbi:UDP-N-acetylmuramyl pentapeptide phosphotransferase [Microbacterium testaceum]|uniref:UDP-N-acetylmuramyl pentapeptide phosphotransferase n=1 Tax=Microbacterium testaceum TaxID=2033 RepID=A0A147EU00_MICTE|nr:hypothetical protein [Microbacterium testaceum]KTR88543.1 UDP-N-acetylmuramyl pentapeptide phosphotransferase [Microbacterium testaceum]